MAVAVAVSARCSAPNIPLRSAQVLLLVKTLGISLLVAMGLLKTWMDEGQGGSADVGSGSAWSTGGSMGGEASSHLALAHELTDGGLSGLGGLGGLGVWEGVGPLRSQLTVAPPVSPPPPFQPPGEHQLVSIHQGGPGGGGSPIAPRCTQPHLSSS